MTNASDRPVCLVTGASRGLGAALARRLGAGGAQIVALARTVGGLEELDDQVRAAGGPPCVLTPLDLTDAEGVARLTPALLERFGRLDLFAHAAGVAAPLTPVTDIRPQDLKTQLALNVEAMQHLIAALDPLLKHAAAPRAVFFTDDKAGRPLWGAYAASKAAAASLALSYREETPEIAVSLFEPPAVNTHLRRRTHPGQDAAELASIDHVIEQLLVEIGWTD